MNRDLAALDSALRLNGETITMRRTGTPDVSVRACVRGYQPNELVGGIMQTDQLIILSPTGLIASGWPMPLKINDKALTQGRVRNVQAVGMIYDNDVLVRIELSVRG